MQASGAVALLASDVPLGNAVVLHVEVHRVAPIAKWPGGALHLLSWIVQYPPVGALTHVITPPVAGLHVPLRRKNEIVVADLGEVVLLPLTAISENNVFFLERHQRLPFLRANISLRIRLRKKRNR